MSRAIIPKLPPRPEGLIPSLGEVLRTSRGGAQTARFPSPCPDEAAIRNQLSARELTKTIQDAMPRIRQLTLPPRGKQVSTNQSMTSRRNLKVARGQPPKSKPKRCKSAKISDRIQSQLCDSIDLNRSRDILQETCEQMSSFRGQLSSFRAMLQSLDDDSQKTPIHLNDTTQEVQRITLGAPGPGWITPDTTLDMPRIPAIDTNISVLSDVTNIISPRECRPKPQQKYAAVAQAMHDCENHVIQIKSELAELKRFALSQHNVNYNRLKMESNISDIHRTFPRSILKKNSTNAQSGSKNSTGDGTDKKVRFLDSKTGNRRDLVTVIRVSSYKEYNLESSKIPVVKTTCTCALF